MKYAILIYSLVGTVSVPEGQMKGYVTKYDPDAYEGRGDVRVTNELSKAQHFDSQTQAMEFWRQPSAVRPLREDGQPNRPLCAFSVEIVPVS